MGVVICVHILILIHYNRAPKVVKPVAKPVEKTESDHIREEYASWRKDHVHEYMEEHNLFSANEFCNSRKNVAHPSVSDLIQLFGPQWKVLVNMLCVCVCACVRACVRVINGVFLDVCMYARLCLFRKICFHWCTIIYLILFFF